MILASLNCFARLDTEFPAKAGGSSEEDGRGSVVRGQWPGLRVWLTWQRKVPGQHELNRSVTGDHMPNHCSAP